MTADRHQRRHSLLLGPMAEETTRSLGPLAWAALEALVTDARPTGDVDVADASVRQLAERLGVAKNTAHRALTALRRAGFIEPLQSRSTSGQFASGSYRLAVAPSILRLAAEAPASPCRRSSLRRSSLLLSAFAPSPVPLAAALPAAVRLRSPFHDVLRPLPLSVQTAAQQTPIQVSVLSALADALADWLREHGGS